MHRLQQRIREVNEEALQKRIAAREVDEMDRLKRLILSGRSSIKDCPPELQDHPVFEFWRLVNKEVERMSKARADAHLKKFRKNRKSRSGDDQQACRDSDENSLASVSDTQQSCDSLKTLPHGESEDDGGRRHGRYSTEEYTSRKYEDDSVKELRELTTVEELYQMADQIIGLPKEEDMVQ